jgi:hypothetical protein
MLTVYTDNSFTKPGRADRPPIAPVYDSDCKYFTYKDWGICFIYDLYMIEIFIPRLFIFDGASIPKFFWRLVGHPYQPRFVVPALVHDPLFGKINGRIKIWVDGVQLSNIESNNFFTRSMTDGIFKGLLKEEKNYGLKVRWMYRGVRLGGWTRFRKAENEFYNEKAA